MSQQPTQNHLLSLDPIDISESEASRFLVCGLGSLGQFCVAKLKQFGVTISAIDVAQPSIWEVPNV